jgi:hypothetical protein
MIAIIVTACMASHLATCRELELSFADEQQLNTPYGCMITGQQIVAKWNTEHPQYTVARWRCGRAGQYAKA